MKAPRYAGGHQEVMQALFKNATVHSHWIESNYQGAFVFCYELDDEAFKTTGQCYLFTTDYFGSCSGCDIWDYASDETARNAMESIVFNDTIGFADENEVKEFFVELKKVKDCVDKNFAYNDHETTYYKFLDRLNLENSF